MTLSIHPTVHLANQQTLTGIWNKRRYKIVRKIGEGARGSIYLATMNQRFVAVKISQDTSVISREVNTLNMLKKVQAIQLGPLLLDVDDAYINKHEKLPFYVMEYIDGVPMNRFIKQKGMKWLLPISSQLLHQLYYLHQIGYVYGDLKPENILIDKQTKQARLVDVGGITQFGRSIREYSATYDRGYWGLGSRKADPAYDLFALAASMMMMDPKIKSHSSQTKNIFALLARGNQMKPYAAVIEKALKGHYSSALDMKRALSKIATRNKANQARKKKLDEPSYKVELISIGTILTVHALILYYVL